MVDRIRFLYLEAGDQPYHLPQDQRGVVPVDDAQRRALVDVGTQRIQSTQRACSTTVGRQPVDEHLGGVERLHVAVGVGIAERIDYFVVVDCRGHAACRRQRVGIGDAQHVALCHFQRAVTHRAGLRIREEPAVEIALSRGELTQQDALRLAGARVGHAYGYSVAQIGVTHSHPHGVPGLRHHRRPDQAVGSAQDVRDVCPDLGVACRIQRIRIAEDDLVSSSRLDDAVVGGEAQGEGRRDNPGESAGAVAGFGHGQRFGLAAVGHAYVESILRPGIPVFVEVVY